MEQSLAYFVKYRTELLAQSLLFVLSAGVLLWFIGSLRSFLSSAPSRGAAGCPAWPSAPASSGPGCSWSCRAARSALAMGANAELPAALAGMMGDLTYALSVIAYVPMGIMLAAVAVASWRFKAFPAWLAWLSAVGAAANLLMSAGIVAHGGPLVPGGVLTYALYLLQAVWQVAVPTVMLVRAKRGA